SAEPGKHQRGGAAGTAGQRRRGASSPRAGGRTPLRDAVGRRHRDRRRLGGGAAATGTRAPGWGERRRLNEDREGGHGRLWGDRGGYVAAFVDAALAREDVGPRLRAHLKRQGWHGPSDR